MLISPLWTVECFWEDRLLNIVQKHTGVLLYWGREYKSVPSYYRFYSPQTTENGTLWLSVDGKTGSSTWWYSGECKIS